ncbi:MAG: DUF4386 domain-containing protein [Myxococcales bacterium]|nr:DUF4386 domain-containing protein [Myxococcales bacterium]MCB9583367.1 DUF4386 domain-containing protein [Polyangiaceae bacterium]
MTTPTALPQRHARIAGAAYLLVILIGVLNGFLVDARLVVADDATTTQNILAHPDLFRVGIAATLVLYVLVLVLVLAWALYEILKVVEPRLARLALLFRVAEAVVGVSTILTSIFVADMLGRRGRVSTLGSDQLSALVGAVLEARTTGMDLVLVLIGVGGTAFCVLLFMSRLVPRALAGWGVVTYVSMLVLGFLSLVWSAHPKALDVIFYGPGALFEASIGAWLLVKGVNEERWNALSASCAAAGQA